MKIRVTIVMLGFLLLSAAGAWAQNTGTIEGTVTDQETGEVMPAVNVSLIGTTKGSATGESGTYRITGIKPGKYRVKASYIGYAPYESEQITISAGETKTLDIHLEEKVWQGNEIVVSGSKQPEKLLESPTTIERVSEDELQNTGGPTFLSSISNLKGVTFTNAGINTQLISARGFN
ncbi:MAG TPA: carboxypeptidase regulatory-like domain-containing protein, partial [Balneolaceae bacterium]|nr:carboxypeptidase regulatory-like domain-containing protein [Balneolaceae bacterium]